MPATKLPKLCNGAPAGLQTLNTHGDNLDSLKIDIEAEHTQLVANDSTSAITLGDGNYSIPYNPGGAEDPYASTPGKHEHPLIARGMAYVAQVTTADPTVITSYGVQLWRASGCLQSMQVLGTGVYFFPISGFTKVWGRATAHIEVALRGLPVDARVYAGQANGSGSTGLVVKTFRLQVVSGNDILAAFHTGFYLVAYGRRQDPGPQPGAAGKRGGVHPRFHAVPGRRRFPGR